MLVLYENASFLILEKEAGLNTTNEGAWGEDSVSGRLVEKYAWAKGIDRGGVCHRLDKQTSGLLLVAKTGEDCMALKSLFAKRLVDKSYLALVGGRVPCDGAMEVPIGKSHFFAKRKVSVDGRGALTYFKILRRYLDTNGRSFTLLECLPKTGRTHQIRVHCAYMGWPLVGDGLYGGDIRYTKRQFLHACKLGFCYKGVRYDFESKMETELVLCLKNYVEES